MSVSNWIFERLAARRAGNRTRRASKPPFARPACERLEDRSVPAGLSLTPSHVYDLNGNLADSLGSSTATLTSDGGQFQGGNYVFAPDKGLHLTGALANTSNYSVVMRFEIDSLSPGFKKIIDFASQTRDEGLYIGGSRLRLYPFGEGVTDVVPNTDFVLTLTVNAATGETKVYYNGNLEATYTGTTTAIPPNNVLTFFEDDNNGPEAVSGSVDYIATFDGVLTAADAATLSGAGLGLTTSQTGVTVSEGQTAHATGSWSDNGIENVTLNASVGSVTRNADGTWAWSYPTTDGPDNSQTVTITATDADGASPSTSFALNVNNVAPSVAAGAASVNVVEGGLASMTGTWSDPGADVVTLAASVGTLSKNADGTWAWVAVAGNGPATQTVTITATDSDGAVPSTNFTVFISNANPDVAAASGSVTANEGSQASMTGTWSDAGGDAVTLTASVGTVVENADHTWLWTWVSSVSQSITITATDSDGGVTVTQFYLTINNLPPAVGGTSGSVAVTEGEVATLSGTWSDPGADAVTLGASVGSIVQNANGTWVWSYATTDGPDDTQTVTITATDSYGASTSVNFLLTVSNVAPTVTANTGQVTVNEGSPASESGTWFDPGADVVTLSASVGTLSKNANGTWAWSYTPADNSNSQTVTVTATDSDGASSFTSFNLIVANVAPSVAANAGSVTVAAGAPASMGGTWSDPGTTDVVTLSASVGAVVRNANGTWSWSYTPASGPASQTVTVTATDNDGASSSANFTLVVTSNTTHVPPVVTTSAPLVKVDEGSRASMSGTWKGTGVITLSASVGVVVRNANGTWSWSYTPADNTDSQTVTITAKDSTGAIGSVKFTLAVANVAPEITRLVSNHASLAQPSADGNVTIEGAYFDAGFEDTHTVVVDWGDGSAPQTISANQLARTFQGGHRYAHGGVFTVTVSVRDDDGAVARETTRAVVTGVGVVDGTLYVIGSQSAEGISLQRLESRSQVLYDVVVRQGNKQSEFTFSVNGIDRIVIVAGSNDQVSVARGVSAEVVRVSGDWAHGFDGPNHNWLDSLVAYRDDVYRGFAAFLDRLFHGGN